MNRIIWVDFDSNSVNLSDYPSIAIPLRGTYKNSFKQKKKYFYFKKQLK